METYPNAVVICHALDMILRADTYASYLTEQKSHVCAAGYFFLGIIPSNCAQDRLNGPEYLNCIILKFVFASAA